jgi:short-subunit dehydrogenase
MEASRLVKGRKLPSSASVAAYGVKHMNKGDVVAVPGFMNKTMAASVRFSPRPLCVGWSTASSPKNRGVLRGRKTPS